MIRATLLALLFQQAAPAGPPKPAPEIEAAYKWMAGNWKCTGKAFMTPFAPEHATTTTFAVKADLDGFWYHAEFAEKKSKAVPNPPRATGFFGWDASKKKLVSYFVGNTGVAIAQFSDGWKDDSLVFSGPMEAMGQKMTLRDSVTKKGDKEMVHVVEVSGKPGEWTKVAEETCKK